MSLKERSYKITTLALGGLVLFTILDILTSESSPLLAGIFTFIAIAFLAIGIWFSVVSFFRAHEERRTWLQFWLFVLFANLVSFAIGIFWLASKP